MIKNEKRVDFMQINEIKISVRNLVEFVLRSGDLDSRFTGSSRALEGTKAHQKIQKEYKDKFSKEKQIPIDELVNNKSIKKEYFAEVVLKHNIEYKDFLFIVEGRADGIIIEGDNFIIDEIKTVTRPLETVDEDYNYLHWAQAKCYAYIYALQNGLPNIDVQITYYNINDNETKKLIQNFNINDLESFFNDLLEKYYFWANLIKDWNIKRTNSIKNIDFPFNSYRKGQRELAVAVYGTIKEGKNIFAQAPTGIGKTISTLFPSIKAMGENLTSKVFYLTAKTITRSVAEEAIKLMQDKGLELKSVTLTAKDKICFKEKSSCNPEECEFAKGHFDRVNNALKEVLSKENIMDRETIIGYSREFNVCPFEFSLDLALLADCIICDYNYAFDPRVYLRRFFDNDENYVFLIDEAHNLVDRARDMFSAELYKSKFLELKKVMKNKEPKIYKALDKVNSYMLKLKKLYKNPHIQKNGLEDIYPLLRKLVSESEQWLTQNNKIEGHEQLLELYFNILTFIRISEFYNDAYVTYIEEQDNDIKIKMFCLDPSSLLYDRVRQAKASIFFSATLTPISYFKDMLGGCDNDYILRLQSPFSTDNRAILIGDRVPTRYKYREKSYSTIVQYIKAIVSSKKGNYIVFFPSYKYMKDVYRELKEQYPNIKTLIQDSSMKEEERELFLSEFKENNEETMIAFAVLGGIFSEGIDLKYDRLIGAIIVSVGIPQVCLERDIIMDYFNKENDKGFKYAYMYPGMNKVLQAAGRVIRTETDKGVIILVDDRFSDSEYKKLFPKEWYPNLGVRSVKDIENNLKGFWGKY
ncbi:ATP-dependent DNA helicase [Clostridium sp. OS1-26]|uniref:ATP-dependent DNA helicase n=1 Tax=Clostridium sp. OS1-26 TaxID=3070681 RepID=UPI0027DFF3BF|nr:ATP-dependent DNA helicase [Clostridium sp. OS1-26]WML37161.1 ATP-dependent DNA helicase [Clostridium sp. OS1-26]